MDGTASPSGRYGVRSRSRPSDQALRVLAAQESNFVSGTRKPPLGFSRAWHKVAEIERVMTQ